MKRRTFLATLTSPLVAGCGELTTTPEPLPSSASHEGTEVTFSQWYAKRYFRYFDSEAGELRQHYPERDWWLEVSVPVRNLGGVAIPTPPIDEFSIRAAGNEHELKTEIPGLSWDALRLREHGRAYWFEPGWLPGYESSTLDAGEEQLLYAIADINKDETPTLVWTRGKEHELQAELKLLPEGE
jgi:hypothetical protein